MCERVTQWGNGTRRFLVVFDTRNHSSHTLLGGNCLLPYLVVVYMGDLCADMQAAMKRVDGAVNLQGRQHCRVQQEHIICSGQKVALLIRESMINSSSTILKSIRCINGS